MSQIKYLVYAFLLLAFLSLAFFTVAKLSSVEIIGKRRPVIDYVEKPGGSTVSLNPDGKSLFAANCAACHALDKILTGPALRGVTGRGPWTNRKTAIAWVKNPAATYKRFDYTKDLVKQFDGQTMPSFSQLTDAQIEAILDYIGKPMPYPAGVPVAMK